MDNKKGVLIAVLGVGIVAMTVAFAVLSTNLRISGTASIPNVNWNIHFASWAEDTASTVTKGGVTHQNTAEYPSISTLENSMSLKPNVTLVEDLNITLKQPGDYAKYTFEIVNSGTIDASLDTFEKNLTCAQGNDCSHLSYEIECKDALSNGNNVLTHGSTLSVNQHVYCSLTLTYSDQTNQNSGEAGSVQTYTQLAATATLDASWRYIQKLKPAYSYKTSNSGTQTNIPTAEKYIRINTVTNAKEVCGVFTGGTVCIENNKWDCGTIIDNQCTNSNGYIMNKKAEFEQAGATCTLEYGGLNCRKCGNSSCLTCTAMLNGYVKCGAGYAQNGPSIDASGTMNF